MDTIDELIKKSKNDSYQTFNDTQQKKFNILENIASNILKQNKSIILNCIENNIKTELKYVKKNNDSISLPLYDDVINSYIDLQIKHFSNDSSQLSEFEKSIIHRIIYDILEKELINSGYSIENSSIILKKKLKKELISN